MPTRIQRRRTRGWRAPDNCRYVGRPTQWGNPCEVLSDGDLHWLIRQPGLIEGPFGSRESAIDESLAKYRGWLRSMQRHGELAGFLEPLREYEHLSCWCPLDKPCHVDVLIEAME